uniref:Uncharacterized protein n=1 Tax=viral metagenome TaxID=1070528 RepID=A0A6H1ZCB2_9ZZZZ
MKAFNDLSQLEKIRNSFPRAVFVEETVKNKKVSDKEIMLKLYDDFNNYLYGETNSKLKAAKHILDMCEKNNLNFDKLLTELRKK